MKQVNSLKFWHGLLFMLMMVSFTACVDDNEDTEAPFLEVNPATLTFENGGVQTLEISTNRQWKATVEEKMRIGYHFQRHKEKVLTRFKSVCLKVPLGKQKSTSS